MRNVDLENPQPLDRREIIRYARECVGAPFMHQGRSLLHGLDCVGLIRYPLVKMLNIDEDYRSYSMHPTEQQVTQIFGRWFIRKYDRPEPGDILLLEFDGNAQHFALLTDTNTIIHSLNEGRCEVVEHAFRAQWPGRRRGQFEYPGALPWAA